MKLNNRGMTLIEMIVSFAILGVVSVAVFGMLLTATKTYTSLTTTIKLQYEAQLAMANIERHVVNCNEGIAWNSGQNALFIINEEGGTKNLQVIYLDKTSNELYYGTQTLNDDGQATLSFYLLAEHVDEMMVTLTPSGSDETRQVQLELKMTRNNKTYTGKKTIALRNKPSGNYTCTLSGAVGTATLPSGS